MKLHIKVFIFCIIFFSYLLAIPKVFKINVAHASQPLLIDIIPGPDYPSIGMDDIIDFNDTAIFLINDPERGDGLWKSDGTSAGTKIIRDFYSGDEGSYLSNLTKANNYIFFNVMYLPDGSTYYADRLWRTDGTENGTIPLKDIKMFPGANVNGTLFFFADDGIHGKELWKSDGTEAGTVMVKDITPGSTGTQFVDRGKAVGNYFVITINNKLWSSDGTENGTKQIMPTLSADLVYKDVIYNGYLYFYGITSESGAEPWRTNGTLEGTNIVKDIVPGSNSSNPGPFVVFNNYLYFWTSDEQFYKSNGTSEGTLKIHDVTYYPEWSDKMVEMGNDLYFIGSDWNGEYGVELWKIESDNDVASMVKDIFPGSDESGIENLTVFDDKLYFVATDDSEGGYNTEPWVSDGTEKGTQMLANINPLYDEGSYPRNFTKVGDKLFFIASTEEYGEELYVLGNDHTASNDSSLLNITVSGFSISPSFIASNTSYTLTVPKSTTFVSVTPTVSSSLATILINGKSATSDKGFNFDVNDGVNTINILVTAEDGSTKTLYTLSITRQVDKTSQDNDNGNQENNESTQTLVTANTQNTSNLSVSKDEDEVKEEENINKNSDPVRQFFQNTQKDIPTKKRNWWPLIVLTLFIILVAISTVIKKKKSNTSN